MVGMKGMRRGLKEETERTANPVQTTAILGLKRGFLSVAVDGGKPFMIAAGIGTILI